MRGGVCGLVYMLLVCVEPWRCVMVNVCGASEKVCRGCVAKFVCVWLLYIWVYLFIYFFFRFGVSGHSGVYGALN